MIDNLIQTTSNWEGAVPQKTSCFQCKGKDAGLKTKDFYYTVKSSLHLIQDSKGHRWKDMILIASLLAC